MKSITTIVKDIYELFSYNPIKKEEKEVDKLIDTFGNMLKIHVKDFLYERPRQTSGLRLSAIGKPNRQLWYETNLKKKEENLPPSLRIKFLYGYILEELLLVLAQIAGHNVEAQQKEVKVEGVLGHQDAIIDGVLVDCKSASGRSFEKFKNNLLVSDDPFGYIAQISAYAEANNLNQAAFLVIDKSTGEICLTPIHEMEMINAPRRVRELKTIVKTKTPPAKCYTDIDDGKSGNKKLAIGCVYCKFKEECWSDANGGKGLRVFKYANGNRYLTQVVKLPDVQEIYLN
tara:strand:+ start:5736 stop:6596 length:861 start_codon:yes stop_codon:yes gene_type:complete